MTRTGPFCRSGFSLRILLAVVPAVSVLPVLGITLLPRFRGPALEEAPLTCVVQRMEYVHEVSVKGELESTASVEVKCEVEARNFSRTQILEIVPEGTYVEEGDFLFRLDSSPLEDLHNKQEIICNTSDARVVEAQADFETAKITLEQYVQSTYVERRKNIESKVFVAEEGVRRAQRNIEYSRKLVAKGYITELQVQADEFAVEKAKKELEKVRTEMSVLDDYTRVKMEKWLGATIRTAEAEVKSEEHSHTLKLEELEHLREQIGKCEIRSPGAGNVVYVHLHHRGHSHIIEEGAEVREHQVIIRLPDLKKMHVKCKIPEGKVTAVKPGCPVTIRFDAFADVELLGEVQRINAYPESTWWVSTKEYETTISLDAESVESQAADLRPGMTAEVKICLERMDDELQFPLQVPLQAVIEHGSRHYCLTCDSGDFEAHEVEVSGDNGKRVIITGGLEEGQEIVLGAKSYLEEVELPELLPGAEEKYLDIPPTAPPRGGEQPSTGPRAA
jgi:HlyD family secretion protein